MCIRDSKTTGLIKMPGAMTGMVQALSLIHI